MDSYDQVSLAVNGGSAAARLGVETGDEVLVRPLTR
jgi:S-adenosylmethionine hydrolase